MAVYGVAQVNIHDREGYQEYIDGFREMFFSYGGELLVVDDDVDVVEGEWPFTRMVITRFESKEAFYKLYNCEEYQALIAVRQKFAVGNIVLVDEVVL